MQKRNYNPFTKSKQLIEEGIDKTAENVKQAGRIQSSPSPVKNTRENISAHEAGLRKLRAEEEAARQRALARRKMKRG